MYTFYPGGLPGPGQRPAPWGMGGISLAIRSILDLSRIDLIPVNNKNTQSVVYYLKKTFLQCLENQ
jgi:hypothetical protein